MKMNKMKKLVLVVFVGLLMCGIAAADWSAPSFHGELNNGGEPARIPFLSSDGLTMYFGRNVGSQRRMYEAYRDIPSGAFTSEREVTELYNGESLYRPWVTSDGLRMYYAEFEDFTINTVLRMAERNSTSDPWTKVADFNEIHIDGWGDHDPSVTADELTLFFRSTRNGGTWEIWTATRASTGDPFSSATAVSELNDGEMVMGPCISSDGLTIYYAAIRDGNPTWDIYKASRSSTGDPFGNIERVSVSTDSYDEWQPYVTPDEGAIYFFSTRGTGEGIWVSDGITYYVDDNNGSDLNDGWTVGTAFATIQHGIDETQDGDTVLVLPGEYVEDVDFLGKAITLQSYDEPAVIRSDAFYAVSFYHAEGPDSILKNFIIADSSAGILCLTASPTISNLTVINSNTGILSDGVGTPVISNCIFWENQFGDLFNCSADYSIVQDNNDPCMVPLFVDDSAGDYRLKSERGRYWPPHDLWVLDNETCPGVNGGDPATDPGSEPMPNGGYINIGAYGGTSQASMGDWPIAGDVNLDGIVNFKDIAIVAGDWLDKLEWAWNESPVISISSPDNGEIVPYNTIDPVIIEAEVSDIDGSVVKVEFFANASKVAEDNIGNDGWQGHWHPESVGGFTLTAKATDDDGATTTSSPIQVEVAYVW
jgi:hypothetical protein